MLAIFKNEDVEFKAVFNVIYAPGELRVVGLLDNNEVENTILRTSGSPANINLKADRTTIFANGKDLTFVSIEVTDKDGIIQPNAENRLQFKIDGPGKIVGVDNANLKDTDPYVGSSRKAWHGRALMVIRSTKKAGDITLTVSSPGLTDATITIKAEKQ